MREDSDLVESIKDLVCGIVAFLSLAAIGYALYLVCMFFKRFVL